MMMMIMGMIDDGRKNDPDNDASLDAGTVIATPRS